MASLKKIRRLAARRERLKPVAERLHPDVIASMVGLEEGAAAYALGEPAEAAVRYAEAVKRHGKAGVDGILEKVPERHHVEALKALRFNQPEHVLEAVSEFPQSHSTEYASALRGLWPEEVRGVTQMLPADLRPKVITQVYWSDAFESFLLGPIMIQAKQEGKEAELIVQIRKNGVSSVVSAFGLEYNLDDALGKAEIIRRSGLNPHAQARAELETDNVIEINQRAKRIFERTSNLVGKLSKGTYEGELPWKVKAAYKHGQKSVLRLLRNVKPGFQGFVCQSILRNGVKPTESALAMGVKPTDVGPVARGIRQLGARKAANALTKYWQGGEAVIPRFWMREPDKLEELYERLGTARESMGASVEKPVGKGELASLLRKSGIGKKQALEIADLREEWTGADLQRMQEMVAKAYPAKALLQAGIKPFPGSFRLVPATYSSYRKASENTLAIYPDGEDWAKIVEKGGYLHGHVPGSIAFAHYRISGDKLIVIELQSDLASSGVPIALRKRYSDWHKMMLLGLERVAHNAGLKEVWLTTAEHQMRAWPGSDDRVGGWLHPQNAAEAYARVPHEMGFELRQLRKPVEAGKASSSLFWVKPVNIGTPTHRALNNLTLYLTPRERRENKREKSDKA